MAEVKKILIVDDSSTSLYLMENILENHNFMVIKAASGDGALKYLKREVPDLVLLDLMMPHISGFEVLEWMRANPQTADVPVVVVSAVNEEEALNRARKLGVLRYFLKPIDIEEFLYYLYSILNSENSK